MHSLNKILKEYDMSNCRFCGQNLKEEFVDLGFSPPSNSFLKEEQLNAPEVHYPLKVMICTNCYLVQTQGFSRSEEIFHSDYAYFSSYSSTWLQHAKTYADRMVSRFGLNQSSLVVELASNDGYLLQYFKEKQIPVLGVEPSSNTADVARSKGINTLVEFFGTRLAQQMSARSERADLLVGNNVLAHVPDIGDFVKGMKEILKPSGLITMEFPHLMKLIQFNQFDTIYHEHFSYLSFTTVRRIFESAGLELFEVEEIPTHGGSLRIYAKHKGSDVHPVQDSVSAMLRKESAFGLDRMDAYAHFQNRANAIKNRFNKFLIDTRISGKTVAAYGAAAKGNTLINFCGIRKDLIHFVVDASPHKQGRYTPGTHIPVVSEESIREVKPDYVVIFPWNIRDEISEQLEYIRRWGGKFVVAIPGFEVF